MFVFTVWINNWYIVAFAKSLHSHSYKFSLTKGQYNRAPRKDRTHCTGELVWQMNLLTILLPRQHIQTLGERISETIPYEERSRSVLLSIYLLLLFRGKEISPTIDKFAKTYWGEKWTEDFLLSTNQLTKSKFIEAYCRHILRKKCLTKHTHICLWYIEYSSRN